MASDADSKTAASLSAAMARTPDQILGPFYPVCATPDRSGDLTRVPGRPGRARGQVLIVTGRVLNAAGQPVAGARIEVWQANAAGRYRHPADVNSAPLDPDYGGFAALTTDAEGRYRFTTVKPGSYPMRDGRVRPPHIHFDVAGRFDRLVTQMYFEGEPGNDADPVLQGTLRGRDMLITRLRPAPPGCEPGAVTAAFDIVLQRG